MSKASKADLAFGKTYERPLAEALAARLWPGSVVIEAAEYSDIDWMVAVEGKLVAAVEVKARRIESTKYEDTLVAWAKYDAARGLRKHFKVRTACLVAFSDRAGFFWLDELPNGRRQIVRRDRPGSPPVEHALYLHERFTWVDGLLLPTEPVIDAGEGTGAGGDTAMGTGGAVPAV